jgi:hypothetical protein
MNPPPPISRQARDSGWSLRPFRKCHLCLKARSPLTRARAQVLAQDHARVRAAAAGSARVNVEPVLPPDVIGLYVLVPAGH